MNSRPRFVPNLNAVRFKDINKSNEPQQTESNETNIIDTTTVETPPSSLDSRPNSFKQRTIVQQEGFFGSQIESASSFDSCYIDIPKCLQDSSNILSNDDNESASSASSESIQKQNIFEDCDFVTFKVPKGVVCSKKGSESGQIGKLVQLRSGKWKFMLNSGQLLSVHEKNENHSDNFLTDFDFDAKTNICNCVNLGVKTSLFSMETNN